MFKFCLDVYVVTCVHWVHSVHAGICVCNVCSANNFALKSKRKTISANDIFQALEDMELEDFVPELKDCLEGQHVPCVTFCAMKQVQCCMLLILWGRSVRVVGYDQWSL